MLGVLGVSVPGLENDWDLAPPGCAGIVSAIRCLGCSEWDPLGFSPGEARAGNLEFELSTYTINGKLKHWVDSRLQVTYDSIQLTDPTLQR